MCCGECDPHGTLTPIPLGELLADPRVVGLLHRENGLTFLVFCATLRFAAAGEQGIGLAWDEALNAVGATLPGTTAEQIEAAWDALVRAKLLWRWFEGGWEWFYVTSLDEWERAHRDLVAGRKPGPEEAPRKRPGFTS
jgi:hypothetical protein